MTDQIQFFLKMSIAKRFALLGDSAQHKTLMINQIMSIIRNNQEPKDNQSAFYSEQDPQSVLYWLNKANLTIDHQFVVHYMEDFVYGDMLPAFEKSSPEKKALINKILNICDDQYSAICLMVSEHDQGVNKFERAHLAMLTMLQLQQLANIIISNKNQLDEDL